MIVTLREITEEDLPAIYDHQRDEEGARMADRPIRTREEFDAHWARLLADDAVGKRAILADGDLVGSILSFEHEGHREVGYWIDRAHWGRGIVTRALTAFLDVETTRPLYAGVVPHNAGSRRVLEKCGFTVVEERTDGLLFRLG